jgi:glycosyltransferase involved in cell wall biosynthesis
VSGSRPEVAFVVQRYGEGITGGSESLARAVAERLTSDYRITVFTSCARDYVTWRNELPEGLERLGGVDVLRFPAERERDLDAFNAFAEPLYDRGATALAPDTGDGTRRGGDGGRDQSVGAGSTRRTRADEREFLRLQGPEVPKLVEALRTERERFAAFVFFTYLYYPTYWGLAAVPERAALVPTTHDEPPLRFSIYREVFALPRAFGFLTPAEEALVRRRFDLAGRPAVLAGMGVNVPAAPDPAAFQARHGIERPYAIYAGRIDAGKGCAEMLAHHERYRREKRDALDLLLIGRLAMPEPAQPGVRYLGFLPEDEKAAALAGAHAVVCPSPFESLSIALLEGFALGTPGLVNARSEVLKEHCLRSGASLFYEDADEYAEALDLLARDAPLRAALGASGRRYVEAEYRWDVVLDRWRDLIRAAAGGRI